MCGSYGRAMRSFLDRLDRLADSMEDEYRVLRADASNAHRLRAWVKEQREADKKLGQGAVWVRPTQEPSLGTRPKGPPSNA